VEVDFYAVPDPLPAGAHGTLLRHELVRDHPFGDIVLWRVMFLSESLQGAPIAVTGLVMAPPGPAPAGGWRLLGLAHGTAGITDDCAPSRTLEGGELEAGPDAVAAGYVVAVADYEGLGTPGVHPYLVGASEGRGVLDSVAAARQLPGLVVEDRYAIWGYSQGGHAAAWAHELDATWGPDVPVVGAVVGAPATEMQAVFGVLGTLGADLVRFFFIVAGYAAAYPEADPALVLTDAGIAVLARADDCADALERAIGDQTVADLVRPDVATVEPWATLMAANDPGHIRVDTPVLILHSAADTTVPAILSEMLYDRMRSIGQPVERRVLPEGDHVGAIPQAMADGLAWLDARYRVT
jgi:alpha-beta hydrolase superfamily lysophospholipase